MPEVEAVYRNIFSSRDKGEKNVGKAAAEKLRYQNVKVDRRILVSYLKKRYSSRLAQKLASIFDWSNIAVEYDVFYKRLEEILLVNHRTAHADQRDPVEHVRTLKRFAFQMLDMNCDQMICETDLFSFLELHKEDDYFHKTMFYDLQDIVSAFSSRNESLLLDDEVMDHTQAQPKITDLPGYLERTRVRAEQRREIYNQDVFTSSLV